MLGAAIIADIRELCSMGFDWQTVVPTLLHLLHELVPSRFNMFFWVDEQFEISNAYAEFGPLGAAMNIYLERFYNQHEAAVRPRFSDSMRAEGGVADWEQYYRHEAFLQSDFYREVFEPAGIRYTLRAYIPVGNRNSGLIILNRPPAGAPFNPSEKKLLAEIIPYVSGGMAQQHAQRPHSTTDPAGDRTLAGGEAGLLLLDQHGQVYMASPRGRYLLFLATHPVIKPATVRGTGTLSLPPECSNLLTQAAHAFRQQLIEPYSLHHRNGWGRFSFCAHLLDHDDVSPLRLGVSVHHHEPQQIKLLRAMGSMPLSPGQKKICLLLLEGQHYPEIAEYMNISTTTVRDYVHAIYRKLDVHSHQELLEKLFSNQSV